jgi:hypothetical protein
VNLTLHITDETGLAYGYIYDMNYDFIAYLGPGYTQYFDNGTVQDSYYTFPFFHFATGATAGYYFVR